MSPDRGRASTDDGRVVADILLATHRRADLLREMLSSLAGADDLDGVRQILLIENGARDGSEDVAREFEGVLPIRYEFVEEANKSAALNEGLLMSDADLLIFFDDDVRVSPGTIAAYVDAAQRCGRGHFFGGRLTPWYEGEPPPQWLIPALPYTATGFDLGPEEIPHHEFMGPNWAAFRQDLVEIGGFSTRLGPGSGLVGQETEAQSRLTAHACRASSYPAPMSSTSYRPTTSPSIGSDAAGTDICSVAH
ncbi:MAG: glycosyltransferase [Gemmatimonadetes bacterium]|nr:glycosyltransferase [Gemmatimonadota bacterium]